MKKNIKSLITCILMTSVVAVAGCSKDSGVADNQDNESIEQDNKETENTENNENTENTGKLSEDAEKYSDNFMALDTSITVILYDDTKQGDLYLKEAKSVTEHWENVLSKTIDTSFTSQLNASKEYEFSDSKDDERNKYLVNRSLYYYNLTDGAFDVTIEPLVGLWGFGKPNQVKPNDEDIQKALERVSSDNIVLTDSNVALENNATVDFGGIAKGYIADIVKEDLMEMGVKSALINYGGNVLTIGTKPNGAPWSIGVQDPTKPNGDILATVDVIDKTVVTSGVYQRYFVEDGVTYHHIIDPKTGYPADTNLYCVTIITDSSLDADSLATSCIVLGLDKGLELIESLPDVEAMFMTVDKEIIFSEKFEELYNFQMIK